MRSFAFRFACVLCFTFFGVDSSTCREFHVSVNGSDRNDGSVQRPLRTIMAAARLARPGDVITVHEGVYRERIAPPRGGLSDKKRIVYQAAPGEKVIIKGSEIIKGWKHVRNDTWKVSIPCSFFGDFNPCAVLAFFCELQPEIFTNRGSVFSLLSHSILSGIEQRLIQLLRSHQGPLPEPLLTRRFQESIPAPSASEIRVAPLIARDSDRILTTIDGRHLLPEHLSYVVAERMQQMTLPAHFRDIARAVNDLLTPASRVGAGIVLRQLNSSSLFSRVDRGLYTLAPRTGYAII